MSFYTTQLRFLLEKMAGYTETQSNYHLVNDVIAKTWNKCFGNYPIFREEYRETLNKKILLHFYQQEIGFETEGEFVFRLNVKMNEIMPYYNKLYETELLDFNPFENLDYEERYQGENKYNKEFQHGHNIDTKQDDTTTYGKNVKSDTTYGRKTNTQENSETTYGKVITDDKDLTQDTKGNYSDTGSSSGSNSDNSTITYGKSTSTASDTTRTDNLTQTTNTDGTQLNKYLDTPEGTLENFKSNVYLTDVREITDDIKVTQKNTGTQDTDMSGTEKLSGSDITKSNGENSNSSSASGNNQETVKNTGTDTITNSGKDTGQNTGSETLSGTDTLNETNSGNDKFNRTMEVKNSGKDDEAHIGSDAYIKNIKGKNGMNPLDVLQQLRDSFLNIDMMIINELSILFMQIY